MKHNFSVTLIIIGLFLVCHLMGLFLVSASNQKETIVNQDGTTTTTYTSTLPDALKSQGVPNPEIPITIGVLIGTGIMLLLIKFKLFKIVKGWHITGIVFCFFVSILVLLNFFFPKYINSTPVMIISIIVAVLLAILRTYKSNVYIHNISEVFIYGGIAVLFVQLFKGFNLVGASIWSASILLIVISIYDAIAVWQSKHMITLANAQTEQKVFAGLFIPYKRKDTGTQEPKIQEQKIIYGNKSSLKELKKDKTTKSKNEKLDKSKVHTITIHEEVKSAILGGGDIAFTLIFSGVILLSTGSFLKAAIVSIVTTLSLAGLLFFAKKDKFYPAMPFLSAGCFIGYGIILLLP